MFFSEFVKNWTTCIFTSQILITESYFLSLSLSLFYLFIFFPQEDTMGSCATNATSVCLGFFFVLFCSVFFALFYLFKYKFIFTTTWFKAWKSLSVSLFNKIMNDSVVLN